MEYLGSCHCAALGFAFSTQREPAHWPVRACQCRFCRSHGARTTSDPAGSLALLAKGAGQLVRYRFGLGTAEFWICGRCGVYVGAVTSDGRFGLVNLNALVEPIPLPDVQSMSYDGETSDQRIARRAQRWTPIRPAA
jgi:hypothetical protein